MSSHAASSSEAEAEGGASVDAGVGARGVSGAAIGLDTSTEAASSTTTTRLPPRRVIYRNAALTSTAPELSATVHDSELIREAQRIAEEVRDKFKAQKTTTEGLPTVTGEGESADAMRHKRRLQMNRRSAANSRLRRDAYVSALEKQLMKVEVEYRRMEAELCALQTGRAADSSTQENQQAPTKREVSEAETLVPAPPPAPPQPEMQTEIPPTLPEETPRGCAAPPAPSAADSGQDTYLSAYMLHLASDGVREAPLRSEQSALSSAEPKHFRLLPADSGWPDTAATDPASMPLPDLISDLADMEPGFFERLISDFDSQNGEQAADMFTSEMLSYYRSLPE